MPNITHISFDLDGVIVDTENIHYECLNKSITEVTGIPIEDLNDIVKNDGTSTKTKLKKVGEKFSLSEEILMMIDTKKQKLTTVRLNELVMNTDLIDMFSTLSAKYKLSLVSNSRAFNVNLITTKLEIQNFFDCIVTPNDILKPKPSSDMYNYVLGFLGVGSINTIILEDSPAGIEAAKNTNSNVVEVTSVNSLTLENVQNVIETITYNLNTYGGERKSFFFSRI
jgi:HAD superfamily hydrolase (TIGR01509 family)